MNRHLALVLVPVAAALLVGCGQVQDAASGAASDAASKAATAVGRAAADQVRGQICSRVQDGQVSEQDRQVLSGLVGAAEQAGVPAEVTTPLRQVADAGDQAPAEAVDALKEACASTATSS